MQGPSGHTGIVEMQFVRENFLSSMCHYSDVRNCRSAYLQILQRLMYLIDSKQAGIISTPCHFRRAFFWSCPAGFFLSLWREGGSCRILGRVDQVYVYAS